MPDMTAEATQVGQMLLDAMRNALGMDPHQALAEAQAQHGVTNDMINHADMGKVFDYMCRQPGLSPELHTYLSNSSSEYNNYGNINQGGSSYTGEHSGYSGGGYSGGYSGHVPNTRIIEQVTNNYASTHVNDNHIDITGPVSGDISIDQQNNQVEANGDHNAVNTGSGSQNVASGDHSSAAQSGAFGQAQSNSGDGAVQVGGGNEGPINTGAGAVQAGGSVNGPTNTGTFTGVQNQGGDVHGVALGTGNTVLDSNGGELHGTVGTGNNVLDNSHSGGIHDSSIGFGSGDTSNASHDTASGASAIGGHDATGGTDTTTNTNSDVNTNTGSGHAEQGGYGEPVRLVSEDHVPTGLDPVHHTLGGEPGGEPGGESGPHDNSLLSGNYSPEVNVNVQGEQHVDTGHEDVLHHG